jgi:3-hydroxyacyl-[acyl-carrier protein] dehydratase/trans-2-decenoyl-[acyl-carrier protein] isomerase
MEPGLPTLAANRIELGRGDLENLYRKEHDWHRLLVEKFGLPSSGELPSLPQPYMLAFDRATLSYAPGTGKYGKGYAEAVLDVSPQNPWFWCHFLGDPVMPGSQGLDGFLQLTGCWAFFSAGVYGRARALDGSYAYTGQILPWHKKVYYRMDVHKFLKKKRLLYFDGHLAVDDPQNIIYRFGVGSVGFFTREELSIPPGDVRDYYQPDWEQLKRDAVGWIETAQRFYAQNAPE